MRIFIYIEAIDLLPPPTSASFSVKRYITKLRCIVQKCTSLAEKYSHPFCHPCPHFGWQHSQRKRTRSETEKLFSRAKKEVLSFGSFLEGKLAKKISAGSIRAFDLQYNLLTVLGPVFVVDFSGTRGKKGRKEGRIVSSIPFHRLILFFYSNLYPCEQNVYSQPAGMYMHV